MGFPGGSEVKASAWNAGDPGSIPGLEISPGGGNVNLLQYSCLGNPINRGSWRATQTHVHQVGDAIQPSHPLSSPSPFALNLSQHQGLFQ